MSNNDVSKQTGQNSNPVHPNTSLETALLLLHEAQHSDQLLWT
jgi:hypothetical protein